MAIDTKRLSYFVHIAGCGSLSKASEPLHIAQPALSRHIHILQDYLGSRQFVRTGRGMRLTKRGYLRDAIAGPLRDIELATENMRSFIFRDVGFASGIGIRSGLSPLVTTPIIMESGQAAPNLKLRLLEGSANSLLEWLKLGSVDFALLDTALTDDKLSFRMLVTEDLVLVSTRSNLDNRTIAPNELVRFPLILPRAHQEARKIIEAATKQAKLKLDVAFETDSLSLTPDLVRKRGGVALLSQSMVRSLCRHHDDVFCIHIEPALNIGTSLATRSHGDVKGSLITKIDRTIEKVVKCKLADAASAPQLSPFV